MIAGNCPILEAKGISYLLNEGFDICVNCKEKHCWFDTVDHLAERIAKKRIKRMKIRQLRKQGKTIKQIAKELNIGIATVSRYLRR